ncbi:MAG: penicillin-binding protein activator [Methylococcaceae bacterium]|nr:penicillin-binding protein activator [Methylococcaceae bacterium]
MLLSFGEAEFAANKLKAIDIGQLSIGDKIKFYQSSAFSYSLTGNLLESAKARIALDPLLTKAVERKKNQSLILESLGLLPESIFHNPQNQTAGLPEWFAAAKILSTRNQNPASFNASLSAWRAANSQHPANIYLTNIENKPEDSGLMPKSIAVLLPESGPFTDAGKAVKAGFLAAHSRDNSSNKPVLRFYDTEKSKIGDVYRNAVSEGAKLVIGPLNKESIQRLADSAPLTIPVLALNHVPDLNKQNLYQFALSPMDDVAEITQKAASDGHKKALLLVPENEQSKRLVSYFTSSWQNQNGSILAKKSYNPKSDDYSSVIKKLLNVAESEDRFRKVLSYYPAAKSVPRKRQDADVLFLSAYSKEGRIINSQLQLQQAGNLSVYAMPTIFSGIVDSIGDNPLNGITFCDMPWLFDAAYSGDLSMTALRETWSQFPNTYIRLLAMGIDAYHLGAKLSTLTASPYPGATGNLTMANGNRIKRALVCAKFNMGQPELIGFTHSPADGETSKTGSFVNP